MRPPSPPPPATHFTRRPRRTGELVGGWRGNHFQSATDQTEFRSTTREPIKQQSEKQQRQTTTSTLSVAGHQQPSLFVQEPLRLRQDGNPFINRCAYKLVVIHLALRLISSHNALEIQSDAKDDSSQIARHSSSE